MKKLHPGIQKALRYTLIALLFFFLTVLTQIGGIIYLLSRLTFNYINKKFAKKYVQRIVKFSAFLLLYLIFTFFIVPPTAGLFGRVRLPLTEYNNLKSHSIFTCILNRNYVRVELKETAFDVAQKMNNKYPGTTTVYLDANFPFLNKFPMFPHLSHNDGKKLDLAFCYNDTQGKYANSSPSIIGYGVCEEPLPNEENKPKFCADCGYWQYNILRKTVPQNNKSNYVFDAARTKEMVDLFTASNAIGKVFIEPHLKTRLGLTSDKIRFHGCRAVRHDDHLHVQLK